MRTYRGISPRKVLLAAALLLMVVRFAFSRPLYDFVAFWSAAHLLLTGGNPYSLAEMFNFQQALGWRDPLPLMALNPPWALPFIAPIGLFRSFPVAWLFWVALLATAVMVSARWLFLLYGAKQRPAWFGIALAFTFLPTLVCLKFAQLTPLALLGVSGFLWFSERRRPIVAGIFLALTAVKPHLVLLIWLAVLLDAWRQRKWSTFATASSSTVALTLIAVAIRHDVLTAYWQLSTSPLAALYPSAAGALLRYATALRGPTWLQFAPTVGGLIWFLLYWRRHRQEWNWREHLPLVLTVSVACTPWGWVYDQTMLIVVVIALACRYLSAHEDLPRSAVVQYTALNACLIIFLMLLARGVYLAAPIAFVLTPVIAVAKLRQSSTVMIAPVSATAQRAGMA